MVLRFMKKLDNFTNCLSILANADFKLAETNDIYRTGIIGQFNLTFELAKAKDEEQILYADIDLSDSAKIRKDRPYTDLRRTEFYR